MIRSERPSPYTSAVSMKVVPLSSAACRAAFASLSATSPHEPPMAHAPNPISETRFSACPNFRCFILILRSWHELSAVDLDNLPRDVSRHGGRREEQERADA